LPPALPQRRPAPHFMPLILDTGSEAAPKHRQLYDQIRGHVLSGRLAGGVRLPATRTLARDLGCSRNTVLSAYELLLAEGYLAGARGSGTFVAQVLPDQFLAAMPGDRRDKPPLTRGAPALSTRGRALVAQMPRQRGPAGAFMLGPDATQFPFEIWGRMLGRIWRHPDPALLSYGDPAGHRPLREAIADYLRMARALHCDWRQVVITSGAQQALDLVARTLLDPGDRVWCEDPGYAGLRGPLIAAGADIVSVPVDGEGLSVAAGRAKAPGARLVVAAPSHQFPLGVVMSLSRRLELLDWARAAGAWILEDDYDSEYRYAGRPLAALQSLDRVNGRSSGRVIYAGTFSKVTFPSLRVGYLVVPDALVEPVIRVRAALDDHPTAVAQPALAAFISEGHFSAHVRRMRARYAARQETLIAAARRWMDGKLILSPDEAGLHLVAYMSPDLAARLSDQQAAARAADAGISVFALSGYAVEARRDPALLLGYAAVPEGKIEDSVVKLAQALAD